MYSINIHMFWLSMVLKMRSGALCPNAGAMMLQLLMFSMCASLRRSCRYRYRCWSLSSRWICYWRLLFLPLVSSQSYVRQWNYVTNKRLREQHLMQHTMYVFDSLVPHSDSLLGATNKTESSTSSWNAWHALGTWIHTIPTDNSGSSRAETCAVCVFINIHQYLLIQHSFFVRSAPTHCPAQK